MKFEEEFALQQKTIESASLFDVFFPRAEQKLLKTSEHYRHC